MVSPIETAITEPFALLVSLFLALIVLPTDLQRISTLVLTAKKEPKGGSGSDTKTEPDDAQAVADVVVGIPESTQRTAVQLYTDNATHVTKRDLHRKSCGSFRLTRDVFGGSDSNSAFPAYTPGVVMKIATYRPATVGEVI